MLKKLEALINRSPFYNIIRFNFLTDLIIESRTKKTKKAVSFYNSFLSAQQENKLVYDVGANKGNKVKAFLKMGFRVIAVEPEKKALSTLYWRFGRNKNVTIVEKGLSEKEDTLVIHIAESRSGLNTVSDKWVNTLETEKENRWHKKHAFQKSYEIEVTTMEHLYAKYGLPYFIKIDVEGHEVNVIKGMHQLPAFLSFETNLPEFLNETKEIIHHLTRLSDKISFNYSVTDELKSPKWLNSQEMLNVISDPSVRYMEIVCKKF
jgi:FkbM family methyltransferase